MNESEFKERQVGRIGFAGTIAEVCGALVILLSAVFYFFVRDQGTAFIIPCVTNILVGIVSIVLGWRVRSHRSSQARNALIAIIVISVLALVINLLGSTNLAALVIGTSIIITNAVLGLDAIHKLHDPFAYDNEQRVLNVTDDEKKANMIRGTGIIIVIVIALGVVTYLTLTKSTKPDVCTRAPLNLSEHVEINERDCAE